MIILFGIPIYQFAILAVIFGNVAYWIYWISQNRFRWGFALPPLLWWANFFAFSLAGILFRYTDYKLTLQALITWSAIITWSAGALITGQGLFLLKTR